MYSALLQRALKDIEELECALRHTGAAADADVCWAKLFAAVARLRQAKHGAPRPRPAAEEKRPRDALDDEFDAPMRAKYARRA